jgi:hypothetical protein
VSAPQRVAAAALFAIATTAAGAARAAPVPLSAVPVAGAEVPPASGKMRVSDVRPGDNELVTALDRAVCIASFDVAHASSMGWPATGGDLSTEEGSFALEIDHLHEGPRPFLERAVVDSATLPDATVLRRERIPLLQVVDGPIPAYAYRTKDFVHVLVRRGFETASDAFDHEGRGMATRLCGFVDLAVRVTGGVTRDSVLTPRDLPEKERWIVDEGAAADAETARFPKGRPSPEPSRGVNVSLSKVSRDPEPLLSVTLVEQR